MTQEIDITELLFPGRDLTPEEQRKEELYSRASKDALKLVGNASPIALLNKTDELYERYLREEK